jgi:adenylate cyclase
LHGELMMAQQHLADAKAAFHQAIEIARSQEAKSFELRAMMSLCGLWQRQGRQAEARTRLAEIYGWFSEGFDTADLREAKALLAALAC